MRRPVWCVLVALLVSPLSALAATNVGNTSQKGSVLIFPLVVSDGSRTTIIRLANDGWTSINVRCEYRDQNLEHLGFVLTIRERQAIWFDVTDGTATKPVGRYPAGGTGEGELFCWAVSPGATTQIRWNHLSGSATISNFMTSATFEYPAWAFQVRAAVLELAQVGTTPGLIRLNGIDYDACPQFLHGIAQDNPAAAGGAVPAVSNQFRIVVATCELDARQDFTDPPPTTRLNLFTRGTAGGGTTTNFCADYWEQVQIPHPGGGAAVYFRLQAAGAGVCAGATAEGIVGLLYRPDLAPTSGTDLAASETRNGVIRWDPLPGPPE
jgi:hypothetical protein